MRPAPICIRELLCLLESVSDISQHDLEILFQRAPERRQKHSGEPMRDSRQGSLS
jgi:hypothetical protein